MEFNKIVVFAVLALIFNNVSSEDQTEDIYIQKGREKLISLLKPTENKWAQDLEAQDFRNTVAQGYANQWSKLVLHKKFASNHTIPTLENEGVNAIFGNRKAKTDNMDKFVSNKFDKWLETEVLRIVSSRTPKGETLIDIGIGYIHEELSKYSPSKLLLMFGVTGVLQVHLVIVLIFSRHTTSGEGCVLLRKILGQETSNINEASFKECNEFTKIAETWATVQAHTGDKPNINSTPKNVWVTSFEECDVDKAASLIREFFKANLYLLHGNLSIDFAWIQKVEYHIYFGDTHYLERRIKNENMGCFVIATIFPQDFTLQQQNTLIGHIPKFSAKYCALAAGIAHESAKRQSPLANKTSNINIESAAEFTAVIYFPVQTGTATGTDMEIPVAVKEVELGGIEEQISKIGRPVVGGAFGRLIERDTRRNEIKSVTVLVLTIDSDTHYNTLELTVGNLMMDTFENKFFKEDERRHTKANNLKRFQAEVPTYFSWTGNIYQTNVREAEDFLWQWKEFLESKTSFVNGRSRIDIVNGENEDIFYIIFESRTLTRDYTVENILKDIMKTFGSKMITNNEAYAKGMQILKGREGRKYLNLIEDVVVSGYSIEPCILRIRGNNVKVFLVLTVPKTKI